MEQNNKIIDLTLPELLKVFWGKKKFIIILTSLFALSGAVISLILTPIYTSSAILAPSSLESTSLQQRRSNLGSIASIVGISSNGDAQTSDTSMALAILTSRGFTNRLVSKYEILPNLIAAKRFNRRNNEIIFDTKIYNPSSEKWLAAKFLPAPTYLQAHEKLHKIVNINIDEDTDFLFISVEHLSPTFTQYLIEIMITELNLMTSEKAILSSSEYIAYLKDELNNASELEIRQSIAGILESQLRKQMLASVKKNYLLEYIDPAYLPELKTYPRRTLMTILSFMIGFFISISIVWIKFYYSKLNAFDQSS